MSPRLNSSRGWVKITAGLREKLGAKAEDTLILEGFRTSCVNPCLMDGILRRKPSTPQCFQLWGIDS